MAIPSRAELAEQVAAFAERVTPANARWDYALRAGSYICDDKWGRRTCYYEKSWPALARFLGAGAYAEAIGYRLARITEHGSVDAARAAHFAKPIFRRFPDPYGVGPMEAWQIGHVYFARVVGFEHVVKVGFSRRVRDRIEDVESKARVRLNVFATKVGTLADEHWWHRDWRKFRIAGEWFYDPRMAERTLPAFLAEQREAA